MDRKIEFNRFVVLMNTIGEATPQGKPSAEKTEIYFRCLEDFSFGEVEQYMMNHLRHKKFFPTIAEIRGESEESLELQAQSDYGLVDDLCGNFAFAGFGESGMNIIEMKLREAGKDYLIEFVQRHGMEIAYSDNQTATRAQLIKQIKSINHVHRKQIPSAEKKQIDRVNKLIEGVGH